MKELSFYTNARSRGRIVHWMLEELGEAYDTHWIEYGEQMKSKPYTDINPMGKVPAVVHNGRAITEVPAICTYLAVSYPDKGLAPVPGDPALADFYRWMFFAAGPLEQAVTVKSMNWSVTPEQSPTLGFGNYGDTLDAVELALQNGPYVCGEQFTAVDVYLGAHLTWGMMFETIETRQSFADYCARLESRPAAIRANALNEARLSGGD